MNKNKFNLSKYVFKLSYRDLLIFLIPCIIFLYYLQVYDPGILRFDSYNQLHQIATNSYSNWHPFIHTFIYKIWLKIYPNLMILGVMQILIFSTIWTAICKYYRDDDSDSNKIFVIQLVITLFIALIPINSIYSITLLKDTLFSYLILFLTFLTAVLLDRKCDVDLPFIIIFSFTLTLITQIRHNGIIVVILFLSILGIYFFKTNKKPRIFFYIVLLTVLFFLLISSLFVVYEVNTSQKDAVSAKVEHMLADYDLNLDLDKQDRAKIHKMINRKTIKNNYTITSSDEIYFHTPQSLYQKNKEDYIWMAIKYSIKNPKHFIEYLLASSPMVWDITPDDWMIFYYTDIDLARDTFYKSKQNQEFAPINYMDNATSKNKETQEYKNLDSFVHAARENKVVTTLFYNPALCMFLSILLMIFIHWITKSKEIYLVYLPNMINIISIFLSVPTQDCRYLYPNLLVFYLLIIMSISLIWKNKDKLTKIYG